MHNVDGKDWHIPDDFPHKDEMQSIWTPKYSGQTHTITR